MLPPAITPGVQRALEAASRWTRSAGASELGPPELLLGLLDESECRAALWLGQAAIDSATVRQRWPELVRGEPRPEVASLQGPALRTVLQAAQLWLGQQATGEGWATEHLLLGIVAANDETARWLGEQGIVPEQLAQRIISRYHDAPLEGAGELPADEGANASLDAEPSGVLRIVDAAANRAREGLRVVEDYARFGLDDRFLTGELKRVRHDLVEALRAWPAFELAAHRDTLLDVGTTLSTAGETTRDDVAAVLTSNLKRVEESLRSLEEFSKLNHAISGAAIEAIRYRVYTLEKALLTTQDALTRLAGARLYVLMDGAASAEEFRGRVAMLVAAGAGCIQLRAKILDDRQLLQRAHLLRELTRGTSTLAIMNDRADLARLARLDGVHVGQEDLTVKDARAIVGPRSLIGVSTHSLDQARAAVLDGANYIGVGPTFASTTKSFAAFTGLDLLRAVADAIRLPAFAIGGIDAANLEQVLATGISRVAVSGAIGNAADPGEMAAALIARLNQAATQPTSPNSSTRP